jgi:transposase
LSLLLDFFGRQLSVGEGIPVEVYGVGPDRAATLLVTAGDNPERIRSERSWAHLCGVTPIHASSGITIRHRLSRGDDRHANSALHRIVLTRMSNHTETRAYVARRRAEGLWIIRMPETLRRPTSLQTPTHDCRDSSWGLIR